MKRSKFFWKLFLGNALIVGVILTTSVWLILSAFESFYANELTHHLKTHARALVPIVRDALADGRKQYLDDLAKEAGSTEAEGVRITLMAADGTVYGESQADASRMEAHADRAEVIEALANEWGSSTRWSHTVNRELKYVAVRIGPKDAPIGVVRVAMAVQSIGARTESASRFVWTIASVALLAAVLLALGLAALWSKRLSRLMAVAQVLARGDFSASVDVQGSDEVALLGRSLNRMRQSLETHLTTIDRQRNTLESLVAQLREGVVVVSEQGRLLLINPEAKRLMGVSTSNTDAELIGRSFEECIPYHELHALLRPQSQIQADETDRRDGSETQELNLQFARPDGRTSILARACDIVFPQEAGDDARLESTEHTGRLLVLTDITELSRTLQMRTDFAANASHELRTPLSSIRAAVETLHSIDLSADQESAFQFLRMIERQSYRLEELVSDLLDLARLESPSIAFEPDEVVTTKFIEELRRGIEPVLESKPVKFVVDVAPSCSMMRVNTHLLRIVMRNLLDNAVEFTPPGGQVTFSAAKENGIGRLSVIDTGIGISPQDQERVFERFYQVERARSGIKRGSGLGLSIVRHAVAAMKGQIKLESVEGEGTTVTVSFIAS